MTSASGQASDRWHAMLAGFLGWTLDAFDFFVVIFLLDVLAAHFHVPKRDIVLTITATLAMRPVGALLFGMMGARAMAHARLGEFDIPVYEVRPGSCGIVSQAGRGCRREWRRWLDPSSPW